MKIPWRWIYVCGLVLSVCCQVAPAAEVEEAKIAGKRATACKVNVGAERIEIFLRDDTEQPFKSFEAVESYLAKRGEKLAFAMNAGMFHRDLSPVGLFVSQGKEVTRLNTNSGYGNFFMKPNGVFLISEGAAKIVETSDYSRLESKSNVTLATQSGPLLVSSGRIHPRFNSNSTSRVIRNGVGVSEAGEVVFAISEEPVNLYEFAVLFRDVLGCADALYLDGVVSSLHAPKLKRSDRKTELGPMIGVVEGRR